MECPTSELFEQLVQIRGECVVVVPRRRLARFPEPAAVVRNDSITRIEQSQKLLVPRASALWIAVDENHGRTRTVILVVQIDRSRVFYADCDGGHPSLLGWELVTTPMSRIA
jgi:hypothetical protein